jgi:hypothetical protein
MFVPADGSEPRIHLFGVIGLLLLLGAVVAGVIAVTQAQRKIPVQYAQRAVGRKVYAGSSSFMPLRVNYAGVMPIIFAGAILMFPSKIFFTLGKMVGLGLFEEMGPAAEPGAFLVLRPLLGHDHVLLLFLGGHPVQRDPDRRRPEEARRLHPRGAARRPPATICIFHEPDHPGGGDLPDRDRRGPAIVG